MKKNMFKTMATMLLLCLLITGIANGQTYQFKPEWKVGEKKTIIKHQVYKKYEQGELVQEDEQTFESPQLIEVLKNAPDFIDVVLNTDMDEYKVVLELVEKINTEIEFPEKLQITYRLNKNTAEIEVLNIDELFSVYNLGAEKLRKKLDELKNEDEKIYMLMKLISGSVCDTYFNLFSSESEFEKLLIRKIEPIIVPYKTAYQPGDTVISEEFTYNPLNPSTKIVSKVTATFNISGDNPSYFEFFFTIEIDQEQFENYFIEMMKSLSTSFVADEEEEKEVIEQISEVNISYQISQNVLFDSHSNWVKSITTTIHTYMFDPQKGIPYETEMIENVTVQ